MKTYLLVLASLLIFVSCENQPKEKSNSNKNIEVSGETVKGQVYGEAIGVEEIIAADQLSVLMKDDDELFLKLEGKVNAVCQGSGCWVDLDIGNNEIVHVSFKDEAFVLPKDIAGKTAVIDGLAATELVSVNMLKRIAKEDGKTQEEIDAITEPITEYYFEASSVTLK